MKVANAKGKINENKKRSEKQKKKEKQDLAKGKIMPTRK